MLFHSVARRALVMSLVLAACPGVAMAGTVTGTVIDATGTRGLQGADVRIVELGRQADADRDGGFRFADIAAGTYTLEISYAGSAPETRSVTVSDAGETRVAVALGDAGEDILVVGQQANLSSSISRQRAADGVSTVLTRDAIGQFPDQNVAEALRRAPGLNVLNDQGEGRFVSIRGLDPNLNSTSINGNRVLATGGDQRGAALDVIPSELIQSIEIKKSLTPDMDADTIGGSVEISTTSAFDRKKGFAALTAEGSYNELRDLVSPKFGFDFSTPLGENFGVAGGVSYNNRHFSSDNIEMADWGQTADGTAYAAEVDYRDYDVTRERIGASLSFDARLGSTTELYLRGLYSRFDDQELRRRLVIIANEEPASATGDRVSFDSADGRIEVRRDLKDRGEAQTIRTLSFGGKTETGPWKIVYDAAVSDAKQEENGSVDPIRFRRRFQNPGELGLTFDYSDMERPAYSIDFGQAAFVDPAGYRASLLERTTSERASDREFALRTDVTRSFVLANGTFDVQGGVKARFRKKSLDFTIDLFEDGDLLLSDVVGPQSYGLAVIDPVPGAGQWRAYYDRNGVDGFERNDFDSDFASNAEDYSAKEDILAGYLLGRYDTGSLRAIGGLRVERTRNAFNANRLEANEDSEQVIVSPVAFERRYTDWMPSLNLRYEAADDIVLRGGVYRSLVRPNIASIAPRFVIEENDEGTREGTFGNPDLTPYRAWNGDVSAEYYFAKNAVVQVGAFYKSISDFIVDARFVDGVTFNGITVDEGTIPLNGQTAKVKGLEFAYQQAFDFLPGVLGGLIANFNYTFTDAQGRLADGELTTGREIPLPAASRHTFNAVLGYEKGPVSLRFAGTYRDKYLDEVGGDADEDRYVTNHFQFDVTAKYRVTPNVQFYGELVNLFDRPYVAYQQGPVRDRLLQYEEYGITAKFGARVNF